MPRDSPNYVGKVGVFLTSSFPGRTEAPTPFAIYMGVADSAGPISIRGGQGVVHIVVTSQLGSHETAVRRAAVVGGFELWWKL